MKIEEARIYANMDLISCTNVQLLGSGKYEIWFELEREPSGNVDVYLQTRNGNRRQFKTLDAVAQSLTRDLGLTSAHLDLEGGFSLKPG